jgi:molybdopterin-guanine dinucleotide biosynthesis protein A
MGTDKSLLRLGSMHLVEYPISALLSMTRSPIEIVIAAAPPGTDSLANTNAKISSIPLPPGVRLAFDDSPHRGPLAGIQTVLREISTSVAVVAACDMPYVSSELLDYLLEAFLADPSKEAAVYRSGGRLHPFPGVYPRSISDLCSDLGGKPFASVQALLSRLDLCQVALPDWAAPYSLDSLNTPADLDIAMRRLPFK